MVHLSELNLTGAIILRIGSLHSGQLNFAMSDFFSLPRSYLSRVASGIVASL